MVQHFWYALAGGETCLTILRKRCAQDSMTDQATERLQRVDATLGTFFGLTRCRLKRVRGLRLVLSSVGVWRMGSLRSPNTSTALSLSNAHAIETKDERCWWRGRT